MTTITTLIKTYDTETDATRAMHSYARRLRRQQLTGRYAVFVEKRKGVWWLNLVDRQNRQGES